MDCAENKRNGRGWVLRPPMRRITNRVVSDAQLLHELAALPGRLLQI